MLGARSRGFDWREVAKVLRITRDAASATFWREIKRPRSTGIDVQPPATGGQNETNLDTLKPGKPRASR
jgi:hypothetical protein